MSTSLPPEYLLPCLLSIEQAVIATYGAYPRLCDKDVEDIYEQLRGFFQRLSTTDELDEPMSTIPARQALIEGILDALDAREAVGADDALIMNEAVQPGGHPIPNIEALYAAAFNYLRRSARFWRKEAGPAGYLTFITGNVPH